MIALWVNWHISQQISFVLFGIYSSHVFSIFTMMLLNAISYKGTVYQLFSLNFAFKNVSNISP